MGRRLLPASGIRANLARLPGVGGGGQGEGVAARTRSPSSFMSQKARRAAVREKAGPVFSHRRVSGRSCAEALVLPPGPAASAATASLHPKSCSARRSHGEYRGWDELLPHRASSSLVEKEAERGHEDIEHGVSAGQGALRPGLLMEGLRGPGKASGKRRALGPTRRVGKFGAVVGPSSRGTCDTGSDGRHSEHSCGSS